MWLLPETEAELESAIDSGLLEESHFLDFKETLPEPKSGNKSIAKDLASFSIDGGRIIVGIRETEKGLALSPINTTGLSERIEQIALSLVEPPVFITSSTIPSAKDPTLGYLVINIPASDFAPHMVDGRYMARNDKTQRSLSNTEVLRYHESQSSRIETLNQAIKKQITRDPVPFDVRFFPHLHITATPRMTTKPLLLDLLRSEGSANTFREWLKITAGRLPKSANQSRDTFQTLVMSEALRHDGIALYSGNIQLNRAFNDASARRPENIVEIEFSQDGQLRFFNAQVGYFADRDGSQTIPGIAPQFIVEQVREFLELIYVCSQEVGFGGRWDISVAITGISGMVVLRGSEPWFDYFKYESNAEDYIAHVSGDIRQLELSAGSLLEALLGRFIRSVGMEKHFQPYFD